MKLTIDVVKTIDLNESENRIVLKRKDILWDLECLHENTKRYLNSDKINQVDYCILYVKEESASLLRKIHDYYSEICLRNEIYRDLNEEKRKKEKKK